MTIYGYLIDERTIRYTDMANPMAIKHEMLTRQDEILWVHADELGDIFRLQDIFGLHPLAVDAVIHENQPSKIEEYERYLFTIMHGVLSNDDPTGYTLREPEGNAPSTLGLIEDQVFIFLEHRWIITVSFHNHHFRENIQKKMRNLLQHSSYSSVHSQARYDTHFENRYYRTPVSVPDKLSPSTERKSSEMLRLCEIIYRLALEELISSYYGLLDNIRKELDQAEESILTGKSNAYLKTQPSIILILRRKVTFIQGVLEMVARAFENIIIDDTTTYVTSGKVLSNDTIRQIRAVNDRTVYLRNDLENMHQRIISLRESYNSSLTANLNETIRTLTVIATIVLPLTLITGIFGMREGYVPQLHPSYGSYYALGLLIAVGGAMVAYFRWKKWI